jgi:benzoyl-CoA reductase/2-hydroxyglutaryl-CoA dehydratase subunit BcrC/BadD/HgdB
MDLPNSRGHADRQLWVSELKRLAAKVEEVTGNAITPEKLAEATALLNAKRAVLQRLYDLRRARPAPISGLDALLAVQISFLRRPHALYSKNQRTCDELEARVKPARALPPAQRQAHPQRWHAHAHPLLDNPSAHREHWRGVLVAEESCTGARLLAGGATAIPRRRDRQPLAAIADRQFADQLPACIKPPTTRASGHCAAG